MNLSLNSVDFASLSPLWILLLGALILLLLESFFEKKAKKYSFYVTLGTLFVAFYATWVAPISQNPLLTAWIKDNSFSDFLTFFFIVIGIAVTLLSASFFQEFEASRGEYYFFLLASLFGLILIGSSADFLTLFLGLETLSLSLYILCCYMKQWKFAQEAAIKYFLMGSLAAAFLLYGVALIYGATGTTRLEPLLANYHSLRTSSEQILFLGGIAFVTLGLAFKATIFPFHFWAPDAYDGAPTPVTAFMAVGTKVGAFAALAIVFLINLPQFDLVWNHAIAWLAYPTLVYANVIALRQIQLRRFFAYSGMSHAGFLLFPFAAGTPEALPSLLFYLVIYAAATLGAFAVLAFLDRQSQGVMLDDLSGLFRKSPWLAGTLSLCLLTLAGIPPTAGFFAKFYVFKVAFQAGYHFLVILGLLTAILSAYYYLRIVAVLFADNPEKGVAPKLTWPSALLGCASIGSIVLLSVYPAPLLALLEKIQ